MADFEPAYYNTLSHEGGYVSKEVAASIADPGGETYKGIARNYHKDWAGWKIIDAYKLAHGTKTKFNGVTYIGIKHGTVIDDPKLNELHKKHIKKYFWDANNLSKINNQTLANFLFDIGYGSGTTTAAKHLQYVLKGAIVDGVIGAKTIELANKADQNQLFLALKKYRVNWLNKYLSGKSYLKVLLDRTNSFFLSIPQPLD